MFADTPHLLKLFRNHLLDKGVVLPGGGKVNRQFFADVIAIDAGKEFKLLPKLGVESHLGVSVLAPVIKICIMLIYLSNLPNKIFLFTNRK